MNNGLKDYWKGYRLASYDIDNCGLDYALSQYFYGLNGKSDTFCKGYFAKIEKVKSVIGKR